MKEPKNLKKVAAIIEENYGNNWFPCDNGWIKFVRSVQVKPLMARSQGAFCLLALVALRAWRGPGINGYGCSQGEAFIGDWLSMGFTHKAYRVAKRLLESLGYCSFRATNKGTVAKLLTVDIFNINLDEDVTDRVVKGKQGASQGQAEGKPGANEGQAEGKPGAPNKNEINKEGKTERKKERNNSVACGDAAIPEPPSGVGLSEATPVAIPDADEEGEEEEQTPSQKAIELSRELPHYLKEVCGYNQLPVFTQSTLIAARVFFEKNAGWEFWDVSAVCALALKLAREHPAPEVGVDPYYLSRRFGGRPNKIFETTAEGDLNLARIITEVKFEITKSGNPSEKHNMEWANDLFQSELKLAQARKAKTRQ